MQLDIFDDSRDVMLRNDVLSALQRYDAPGARGALSELLNEYPDDNRAMVLGALVELLEHRSTLPFPDRASAALAHYTFATDVREAVLDLLGDRKGAAWMRPLWLELAQRAASLTFRADQPDSHAAPLFLLAEAWGEACEAVSAIESWRRIPMPLRWMTEARYRLEGLDAVWPLLAELAWMSPSLFDGLLKRLDDGSVNTLRKTFDASFDGSGEVADLAWFPAWVLTQKTALAAVLKQAQPSRDRAPEQVTQLLIALLNLEKQGRHHELIERRRALQVLHGPLYAAYIKNR